MTTTPLENSALWQPIEDWPHRACACSLIKSMTDEGYTAKSIRSLPIPGALARASA